MVLGLGGCCGSVAVAAVSPAAGKQSSRGGDAPVAKQQRVVGEEKVKMGGEPGEVAAEGKEGRKKREHQKAPPIVMHQFPFHSRPGLL
ncbi:hypothetical protein SETIT_8G099200v2 [Setaria italica]|uniref:Expressed protein-RZ53 n=2 Tax=Setaria TaxID=4554 RepID=A0A368S7S4_SETIT|nr:uncharacterized protein LOC101767683 [Setaria italica]XP_034569308.1 uncharacterized protein LOC117833819 [Setaria viridis]RCV37890.1 hypothetical protein SETIT_8G099200v2 [Setaria italica]TKW00340.1 hypothetical protein SEVIR_8G102000v2 [Setaria viridis]